MHIVVCCRCKEITDDYVLDADRTCYCCDCAQIHEVQDTRTYECFECGNFRTRECMSEIRHNRKIVHVCHECMSDVYERGN